MFRNRFLDGASWLPLFDADRGAGAAGSDQDGGDKGGDKGGGDNGAAGGAGGDQEGAGGAEGGANQGAGGSAGGAGGEQGGAGAAASGGAAGGDGDRDWREQELARRGRRVREERERREALERENASLRQMVEGLSGDGGGASGGGQQGGDGGQTRTYTQQEVDRLANERAERLALERLQAIRTEAQTAEFNRQCNAMVTTGQTEFGQSEFNGAITQLGSAGFYGEDGRDFENLNMVLQTDDPARVMFELGKNPALFYKLMDLPPGKRQVEFVKISLKPKPGADGGQQQQQRRPSGAPAPVDGIRGGGGDGDNRYSDQANSADWHAQEDQREAEHWKRKQAGRI